MSESKWASKGKGETVVEGELVFDTREACVEFLDTLLRYKMFHRAKKIAVEEKDKKGKKKAEVVDTHDEKTDTDKGCETGEEEKVEKTEKKKRKIRLDMHLEQIFVDSNDAFVWLYDPISWIYWLGGTAIVLGTIAICMFPLWPPMMRQGVHYLSMGAAGFLLLIMGIAVFKYILFGLLFVLSGGKLNFWLFPNLTEDVGFFESFVPFYDYTYT